MIVGCIAVGTGFLGRGRVLVPLAVATSVAGNVQIEGGEAAQQLVALAGVGAEGHVALDDLGVVSLLGLEIEQPK